MAAGCGEEQVLGGRPVVAVSSSVAPAFISAAKSCMISIPPLKLLHGYRLRAVLSTVRVFGHDWIIIFNTPHVETFLILTRSVEAPGPRLDGGNVSQEPLPDVGYPVRDLRDLLGTVLHNVDGYSERGQQSSSDHSSGCLSYGQISIPGSFAFWAIFFIRLASAIDWRSELFDGQACSRDSVLSESTS